MYLCNAFVYVNFLGIASEYTVSVLYRNCWLTEHYW